MSYVIALDQGDKQVRAALIDACGNVVLIQGPQPGSMVGTLVTAALAQ